MTPGGKFSPGSTPCHAILVLKGSSKIFPLLCLIFNYQHDIIQKEMFSGGRTDVGLCVPKKMLTV